jgi:AbrB family looped-hinge helix DNA binding protein
MHYSRLSKKGQLVIPKKVRDQSAIKPGDLLRFKTKGNQIIIEKVPENSSDSIVDLLKRGKPFKKDLISELRGEWD